MQSDVVFETCFTGFTASSISWVCSYTSLQRYQNYSLNFATTDTWRQYSWEPWGVPEMSWRSLPLNARECPQLATKQKPQSHDRISHVSDVCVHRSIYFLWRCQLWQLFWLSFLISYRDACCLPFGSMRLGNRTHKHFPSPGDECLSRNSFH